MVKEDNIQSGAGYNGVSTIMQGERRDIMLVRELIEELQACEQDKEVLALFDPTTYLATCQGGEVLAEILVAL